MMNKKTVNKKRRHLHKSWVSLWLEEASVAPGRMFATFGINTATPCYTAWIDFLNWCAGSDEKPNASQKTCRYFERASFDREMRKCFVVIIKSGISHYAGLTVTY